MALFIKEVAAPYLLKEIDKRIVLSKAAMDISASVPDLAWNGSSIVFPVFSRVAVANVVTAKGSITPTEIDGSSTTAPINHVAAAVRYHRDTLRQSGGPILQQMALTDLAGAMALKLDADLMSTAINDAVLRSACAAADAITSDELEKGFALFGDRQNANEFEGVFINSKVFPSVLKLDGFTAEGLTYTNTGNGIVQGQCCGFYRGVPVFLTDNGNYSSTEKESKTLIVKKGGLAVARKNGVEFDEQYNATTFYTDVVASTYAANKLVDDSKVVLIAKTISEDTE